ncbi:MAG: hypothetical protein II409_01395 [Clostridia bacterium]|nr:hypothetical protein [Clostridia bacterium]
MKTRRILSAVLAALFIVAMLPAASLAEGMQAVVREAEAARKLDRAWAALDAAEAAAMASGADRTAVINAVYNAALNAEIVDSDSFSDFSKDGFFFTVDGMYCAYNYRLRNELDADCEPVDKTVVVIPGRGDGAAICDAESADILLIGPYYGHDSNFTDQYRNEAASLDEATGGDVTILQSTGATGPAIAENFPNKGVVIFDSHGTQSGTSSYLCLTTKTGITQEDFNNGWAINAGSAAYIDGRYIQHHVTEQLANTFVWMAICEGMKRQGRGTTGTALLEAGCGAVYGYSQSVTFAGDYLYEEVFWNMMKDEHTAKEAYEEMISVYGIPDPYGDAYPILMSPVDPFPENPDSAQIVNCEWKLYGFLPPVALESFSLDKDSIRLYASYSDEIRFAKVPEDASLYELVWTSSDEDVVTVQGNSRKCYVNAVGAGNADVICTVLVDGEVFGTASCAVTVDPDTSLDDALNVDGGELHFTTSEQYPFRAVWEDDRFYAQSGNHKIGDSDSSLTLVLNMAAGDTLSYEYWYGAENGYDYYNFSVNGQQVQHLTGSNNGWQNYVYTAAADGEYTFVWNFNKDPYVEESIDGIRLDNVAFSGEGGQPAEADGDLDGDGEVTISDALMAMRIAMGLLDGTDEYAAHGDIDGDGEITISDALVIMRTAMGLL